MDTTTNTKTMRILALVSLALLVPKTQAASITTSWNVDNAINGDVLDPEVIADAYDSISSTLPAGVKAKIIQKYFNQAEFSSANPMSTTYQRAAATLAGLRVDSSKFIGSTLSTALDTLRTTYMSDLIATSTYSGAVDSVTTMKNLLNSLLGAGTGRFALSSASSNTAILALATDRLLSQAAADFIAGTVNIDISDYNGTTANTQPNRAYGAAKVVDYATTKIFAAGLTLAAIQTRIDSLAAINGTLDYPATNLFTTVLSDAKTRYAEGGEATTAQTKSLQDYLATFYTNANTAVFVTTFPTTPPQKVTDLLTAFEAAITAILANNYNYGDAGTQKPGFSITNDLVAGLNRVTGEAAWVAAIGTFETNLTNSSTLLSGGGTYVGGLANKDNDVKLLLYNMFDAFTNGNTGAAGITTGAPFNTGVAVDFTGTYNTAGAGRSINYLGTQVENIVSTALGVIDVSTGKYPGVADMVAYTGGTTRVIGTKPSWATVINTVRDARLKAKDMILVWTSN